MIDQYYHFWRRRPRRPCRQSAFILEDGTILGYLHRKCQLGGPRRASIRMAAHQSLPPAVASSLAAGTRLSNNHESHYHLSIEPTHSRVPAARLIRRIGHGAIFWLPNGPRRPAITPSARRLKMTMNKRHSFDVRLAIFIL